MKIVYHEGYLTAYFTATVESPLRAKVIYEKLRHHYETVSPHPASAEDILRAHSRDHLNRVRQEGKDIFETALLAAGGALTAARAALEGETAFAIVRPPGHHARRSSFAGFCFFNNMAVALAALLESGAIRSAAVVDFDMHWGDGTADIFSATSAVTIVDVCARGRDVYLKTLLDEMDRLPEVDLIGVCAGFDLYVRDWGALLETEDYHAIGAAVRQLALEKAHGRVFGVLEGGYFLNDLGANVLALCRGLDGVGL
ncbi:MAG: histone deacetylase family protein [Syntrophobacteraceae bacterium]